MNSIGNDMHVFPDLRGEFPGQDVSDFVKALRAKVNEFPLPKGFRLDIVWLKDDGSLLAKVRLQLVYLWEEKDRTLAWLENIASMEEAALVYLKTVNRAMGYLREQYMVDPPVDACRKYRSTTDSEKVWGRLDLQSWLEREAWRKFPHVQWVDLAMARLASYDKARASLPPFIPRDIAGPAPEGLSGLQNSPKRSGEPKGPNPIEAIYEPPASSVWG